MKKTILSVCIIFIGFSEYAFAQAAKRQQLDEITLTADSKAELKRTDSGKPVVIITRKEIEQQGASSVAELLNQVVGIEINGSRSNAGQNLGYFIRGGNNRQVSFLIDGAQVSDASGIANDFDLRFIAVDQIEEIEILKGASSSLYGANASTAVINIKLKKVARDDFKLNLSSFVGTNNAATQGTSGVDVFDTTINGTGSLKNGLTYGLTFAHQSTNGLSAAQVPENENFNESDPFDRVNVLGRIGYDNYKDFRLTSYLSFDEYRAAFDNFDFTDAPNETLGKQVRWGTNMRYQYNERGSIVYNDVSTHTSRDTRSSFPSLFNANGYSLDIYNTYDFNAGAAIFKTIAGFNMRLDSFESFDVPFGARDFEQNASEDVANAQIYDPYVNVVYVSDYGLNVNAGARLHLHSDYDGEVVYTLNPSYRLKIKESTFKIFASYATAYVAPSLFQLHDTAFGNKDLAPERNRTIEAGLELARANTLITATFFSRNEENLVVFTTIDPINFTSQYLNNADLLTARGVELQIQHNIWDDKVTLQANYGFTERSGITQLVRIPKHKVNASVRARLATNTFVNLNYQFNDARGDRFFNNSTFSTETVTLDSFQTIDLGLNHSLKNKPVTFIATVSNLLDADYQELFGFETRGRNYKIGVRITL